MDPTYAAGFFDGEGCIVVSKYTLATGRVSYLLEVAIENTYLPVLLEFQAQWGGGVVPKKRQAPHHKDKWRWKAHGENLLRFLRDIQPGLKEKGLQVEIALDFADHGRGTHDRRRPLTVEELALREGYYLALREAKR